MEAARANMGPNTLEPWGAQCCAMSELLLQSRAASVVTLSAKCKAVPGSARTKDLELQGHGANPMRRLFELMQTRFL